MDFNNSFSSSPAVASLRSVQERELLEAAMIQEAAMASLSLAGCEVSGAVHVRIEFARIMRLCSFVRLWPRLAALLSGLFLLSQPVAAQWVTETYALKAGYNAVWLTIDCSDRTIDTLFAGNPEILEIWQWNADASSTQFTESPADPGQPDSQWKVWKRGIPGETTLSFLIPHAAYLIRVADGSPAFSLQLKGKPEAPRYRWKSSGVNFFGFPMVGSDTPSFSNFFILSDILNQSPPIYYYDGGDLTVNPRRLVTPNTTSVVRGKAYWVQTTDYTDFYGPLQVSALNGRGINYGSKLNTATIRIRNATDPNNNQTVTATLTMAASEPAPGQSTAAPPVEIRLRGPLNGNLQYSYEPLPVSVTLEPGEEVDLNFDANRALMDVPDQEYESILQITDDLGYTRIDLPVSATGTTKTGLWLGGAVINSVNRVETIRGPEFDAPLGTPDGEGPETTTSILKTSTTVAGQTTDMTVFEASFDENGMVFLEAASLLPENVIITDLTGTEEYEHGVDYFLSPSERGTVIHGGSGYTETPAVNILGGGGTGASANAVLSAAVKRVVITAGGSGYTSEPTVAFTGDGEGATGVAIIKEGLLTDITVTDGGSGYSTPPAVEITGGGGNGAQATAEISGSVGSVYVFDGGLGYTGAPQVSFTSANGEGSGASATFPYVEGRVTGVDFVEKIPDELGGGIETDARFSVSTVSSAEAGTPDGVKTTTVTSTSRLVTLNGKSYIRTNRVSTGGAAAAPSNFPIRLLLHSPPSGSPATLHQQVFLGERNGNAYAGIDEEVLASIVTTPGATPIGSMARLSSASFPRGGSWPGTGAFGGTVDFTVILGHDAESNPFVHTYHPDHDNWDARFENKLSEGIESFAVTRQITLTFSPTPPAGVPDLTWGVTTLGGTYTEVITGLRSEAIGISGTFILKQVSEVPALTNTNP